MVSFVSSSSFMPGPLRARRRRPVHTARRLAGVLLCAALASASVVTRAADLDVEALRGRVVYIDFWASWCTPCREEFPWLNEMQQQYADRGLVVVAVNVDADRRLANQFLQAHPANFNVVFDPDGTLANEYHVVGMPSAVILDRDGITRFRHVGFLDTDKEKFESDLDTLLKQKSAFAR